MNGGSPPYALRSASLLLALCALRSFSSNLKD